MPKLARRPLGLAGRAVALAALGALPLAALTPSAAAALAGDDRAPVRGTERANAIDGHYIVVLEPHSSPAAAANARRTATGNGGRVTHEYGIALKGFSARLPARAVEALRDNPNVAYLEADQAVQAVDTQSDATWGLDRVDQRAMPLNSSYNHERTGAGVTVYIIDTGIRSTHSEFAGRMGDGYTAISDGRGTADCNGHGTHVAGTVGGTTYGVAKQVTLRPVRVLDCAGSGSTSGVIAGVDWVTTHHDGAAPAVANMSLGGGVSTALDSAVANSINDGVSYAVAAGNDNTDACNGSPSRVGPALTVGSTTSTDARSSFSNYGACLDLFAPGSSITSAWYTGDSATSTISGTSMATPHVTGVAALYLEADPTASAATVSSAVLDASTTGVLTSIGTGSPNRLLYSILAAAPTSPTPVSPSNLLANPGFESGATGWSASSGVITSNSGAPARTGSWKVWLNGYGTSHIDTLSQKVTVPAASSANLSFWLYVTSNETTATKVYDRLRVQVVSGGTTTTLGTFSNLHKGSAYVKRQFDMSPYVGKTVTVKFTGTENSSRATSFVVDDTSMTTG